MGDDSNQAVGLSRAVAAHARHTAALAAAIRADDDGDEGTTHPPVDLETAAAAEPDRTDEISKISKNSGTKADRLDGQADRLDGQADRLDGQADGVTFDNFAAEWAKATAGIESDMSPKVPD